MPKRTGVEIAALETVVLERVNVCHPFQDALLNFESFSKCGKDRQAGIGRAPVDFAQ